MTDSQWDTWVKRMQSLPTTPFKILIGTLLFIATGMLAGIMSLIVLIVGLKNGKPFTPSSFLMDLFTTWMWGVLTFVGIGTLHYGIKRATFKGAPEDDAPADSPSSAAGS